MKVGIEHLRRHGVYFYFHEGKTTFFSHAALALAAGLARRGFPLYSNILSPTFTNRSIHAVGECVYIFAISVVSPELVKIVEAYPTPHKLILCMADNVNDLFPESDILCLVSHENRFLKITGNRYPWPFGLSAETERRTRAIPQGPARRPVLLRNFRPSLSQGLRHALDLSFVPLLERHFTVDRNLSPSTGNLQESDHFQEEHFARLESSLGCLAYGGDFFVDYTKSPYFRNMRAKFANFRFEKEPVVLRWDSFRFWESLAAGCLTFHLDMEKYGFHLPDRPEGWRHYIPIDLEDPVGCLNRLLEEKPRWAEIRENGREWALARYGVDGVAERFLHLLSGEKGGNRCD
ncbi:MAG: glycosyltransferase family 1 protein [Magnetococcales bacterium]|nr:glycosyltransferase family 1 protein [Magnetococcales bacterium]